MLVWIYGGGTQSAAIGVLIATGALPKPDLTVMADTGREATETWDYLREHMGPYLAKVGITVEIAPHSLSKVDLYAHNGDLLPPVFTADGKLPTYCSNEWKQYVVRRLLREKGVKECTVWLGMSFDERERCKAADKKWVTHAWPLVDKFITREGCYLLAEKAGLPRPPKSSCYICPHRKNHQWRRLKESYPEDFRKACEIDEQLRRHDQELGNSGVYLHASRVPLALADLSDENESPLFDRGCNSGYCWT